MTEEYFDQIDQIVEQRWNSDEAAAWGLIFDQAHADSRHAWEVYGVDPDSDLLREPYVRNDCASRIDKITGAVYGGGLPVAQWGTMQRAHDQGITAADMPAGEGSITYEENPLAKINAWLSDEVQEQVKRRYGRKKAEAWRTMLINQQQLYGQPAQSNDDGNLMLFAIFGLLVAFVVALPFMLWVGGG